MKNKIFQLFICLLLVGTFFVVTPDKVSADDLVEGDFMYTVNNGFATVTGYNGSSKVIDIPIALGGYPTMQIGNSAFENCDIMLSVNIPNSVITIGYAAFSYCSNLTSIIIPDSVTIIGNGAFDSCSSLTSVTIGNSVISIGDFVFVSCTSLSSVTIGISVTTIGNYAFDSCSSLSSVILPNSVTSIGDYAFHYCTAMTSITIGRSLTTIGKYAFNYCTALTAINVDEANENYANDDGILYNEAFTTLIQCPAGKVGAVSIYDGVTTIGYNAFFHCSYLNSVIIPNSVTTIGKAAFLSCTSLTSIIIPNSVTSIGDLAFAYCPLTFVTVPNRVITIGVSAFSYCPLTSVTIGRNVTAIGNFAFFSCISLISITFLGSVAPINIGGFWIKNTHINLRGHAYNTSNFPAPGDVWNGLTMGAYIPTNIPPVFSIPSPTNGSMGNALSFSWSIPIIDPEGNDFSWTIHCSNGQTNSGIGESNGTKSLSLSGLHYLTSYRVWVNATDPAGSGLYFHKWFTFMTKANNPPILNTPSPANSSTGILLSFSWSIPINDLEGNSFNWRIECNNGQSAYANGASSGTKSLSLSGLAYSTTYVVWVNATDPTGSGLWTRRWFTFTTRGIGNNPPVFSHDPSPTNGSTGNLLSLNWSISIDDLEGNRFSWTIQCSNGQNSNGTITFNGTKYLTLSGLSFSTIYVVWVNATDPTGSGVYSRKRYTFTTKSPDNSGDGSDGGNNGGSLIDENKKPIANASAGEPYQGFINSEITFDGSNSYDPDGNITRWFWVFGDNSNGTGKILRHKYSNVGTYTITLSVTDDKGAKDTDTITCMISQINNKPPIMATITGPTNGTKNTIYTYTAVSTDADNDSIQYTFDWGDPLSLTQSSEFLPNGSDFTLKHSWVAAGRYDITVTATDNQTISSSKITVYINAKQIADVGYLLDNDTDEIYDAFYSDVLAQITMVQENNGNYNIDSDGDGDWDYTYHTIKGLILYQTPKTPGFELIIIICAIALVFSWMRKSKNN